MDKLKTLQTDLETARDALTALQDELPQFHSLLTDNEHDAETKKRERASLDDQAQAKNRVMVAREMLEQHQSDIATAQAEVTRLEALERREQLLADMAEAAVEAKRQRQILEAALAAGNTALLKHITKIDDTWGAMSLSRTRFLDLGGELSRAFTVIDYPMGWSNEKIQKEATTGEAILDELRGRGIDLNDVLMPVADSRRTSPFDLLHPRQIEQPKPFGWLIHQAIQVLRRHKYGGTVQTQAPGDHA